MRGAKKARESFEYFYPVDSRHSGRDLVPNHLSFFVLNHVAIYDEKKWPKQIVVNGSVLMDGKKMSKSMGKYNPTPAGDTQVWCRPYTSSDTSII